MPRHYFSTTFRCFFISILLMLTSIQGQANPQTPKEIITNVSETLQKKLQDKAFTKNFAQVTAFVNSVIEPHTDFDLIAPLVLGKHWKTASEDEQLRFKKEFQTLIIRAYSRAFVEYNQWNINYLPLDLASGANKAIVKTRVLQPNRQPIDVDYRMLLKKGEWKVYDILIEGASLVTTYRSSFNEEIQKSGSLKSVIDTLAKRNADALTSK